MNTTSPNSAEVDTATNDIQRQPTSTDSMKSYMDDPLFKVDTDVLTTDRVSVQTPTDPPRQRESKNIQDATYIRLDGVTADEFTDDEQSDLLSTIVTELLLNYNAGLENIEMIGNDVDVIEVHDNVE